MLVMIVILIIINEQVVDEYFNDDYDYIIQIDSLIIQMITIRVTIVKMAMIQIMIMKNDIAINASDDSDLDYN